MLIAILGFEQHKWPSVERTRLFYQRALSAVFRVRVCAAGSELTSGPPPDAVLNFAGRAGWELDPRPNCPLVFALHGGPVLDYEFLARKLPHYVGTDLFVVNCRSDEAILRSLVNGGTVRTVRLPLPADGVTFCPRDKAWCRSLLPVGTDYLLGFVARLVPQKNLHGFLHILAEVKDRLAPRTVGGLVIGNYWLDYPVLPYCTERYPGLIEEVVAALGLQDDVTFLPSSITDEQLAFCYAAMDVLVHPTWAIDENFGYAPVEAMACGTPVVGSAYGGLKDTVLDGTTGYLIPTWVTATGIRMDTSAAADAVVRLLGDECRRHRMSAAAADHAIGTFSEAACSRLLVEAFQDAIAARRAGGEMRMSRGQQSGLSTGKGFGELPNVSPSWEKYVLPVSYYVSGSCPQAQYCTRFRLAGRVRFDGDTIVTLQDPAWPAQYRLDEHEMSLVKLLDDRGTTAAETIRASFPPEVLASCLQRLLEAGLLIGSEEPHD